MGRIRKTLAWTFSPGGNMHGLIRAESSAERAAREAAEARQAQAQEQLRLLEEQNLLLTQVARSTANSSAAGTQPQTVIQLSCGHTVIVTDPRTIRWLSAPGDLSYRCRACDADVSIVVVGGELIPEPGSPAHETSKPTSSQLTDELERLTGLYVSGALTDAEFQAAKAQLLGL
jgi:hypothetical protein